MRIGNAYIERLFEHPVKGDQVRFVKTTLETPAGLDERVRTSWDIQLAAKANEVDFATDVSFSRED